jgi:hypothetical protein
MQNEKAVTALKLDFNGRLISREPMVRTNYEIRAEEECPLSAGEPQPVHRHVASCMSHIGTQSAQEQDRRS